jgi:O-antigen/teichoic acid export membrane protein
MSQFKSNFISGVFWTSIEMVINRSFKFFIKLILARVLFPEDYGIIGMAVVFTSIIAVFNDLGLSAALIQRKEKHLTEEHYNAAFWSGIIWSFFIFAIIYFIVSPLASSFYNEPILEKIIPVLSLSILASPITMVHKAIITRKLEFKKISRISNSSTIISGIIALILALNGAGVWALVFNSVASIVVALPQWFFASKWLPQFTFSQTAFKDVFGFGVFTTGTKLFSTINAQIDYLIVGKLLGASALGIYSFAFLLTSVVRSQILQVIEKVIYPIFSQYQDQPTRLKSYYLKILKINIYLIFPIMFGSIIFANNLIPLAFGPKWNEAILIVQFLSIGILISTLISSSGVYIRASGKPSLELKLASINSIFFMVPAITIGTYFLGLYGAALGYVLALSASTILTLVYLRRVFKIYYSETVRSIATPLLVTSGPFVISYIFKFMSIYWILNLFIYILSLGGMIYLFSKKDILILKTTLKDYRSK